MFAGYSGWCFEDLILLLAVGHCEGLPEYSIRSKA